MREPHGGMREQPHRGCGSPRGVRSSAAGAHGGICGSPRWDMREPTVGCGSPMGDAGAHGGCGAANAHDWSAPTSLTRLSPASKLISKQPLFKIYMSRETNK